MSGVIIGFACYCFTEGSVVDLVLHFWLASQVGFAVRERALFVVFAVAKLDKVAAHDCLVIVGILVSSWIFLLFNP